MLREYTLHAISEMYGADTDRDGVFDVYHAPGLESEPGWESQGSEYMTGIKVGFAADGNERRCAVVFDLGQAINVQFPIASAQLSLANAWQSAAATGSYEVHGFAASGPTAALGDLTIPNRLYGPTIGTATIQFPIDVTTFVKSRLAGGARYVGFSVRNVADAGFNSYTTLSERPWFGGSRLAVTIETWGPRLSEAARLDVETSANSTDQPSGTPRHPKAFPISEIVNAAMISRIAASMTEPGARSIQKQAFEMISRIAATEIERLGREEP